MLYFMEGTVVMNTFNPYVQAMMRLSRKDPKLSMYYTLCEIANSKELFHEADNRVVEDFTINLGQTFLRQEVQNAPY
jgi:hypothetical protein